jgi:hypothetical protein
MLWTLAGFRMARPMSPVLTWFGGVFVRELLWIPTVVWKSVWFQVHACSSSVVYVWGNL